MYSQGSYVEADVGVRSHDMGAGLRLILILLTAGTIGAARSEGLWAVWGGSMIGSTDGGNTTDEVRSEGSLLPDEVAQVALGSRFSVGIRPDGTLLPWGVVPNAFPHHLSRVRSVEIASFWSVAVLEDGTVASLESAFSPLPGESNVVEVALNEEGGGVARRADGTLAVWGEWWAPPGRPPAIDDAVAIAMHGGFAAALRADGSVLAWRFHSGTVEPLPDAFRGVRRLLARPGGLYGIREDGSVVGWGGNSGLIPPGLKGVVDLAGGVSSTLALREDGTVVGWGSSGARSVPAGLSGVSSIAVGGSSLYAVKSDGTVVSWGDDEPLPEILSQGVARIVAHPHGRLVVSLGKSVKPEIVRPPEDQLAHGFQGVRLEVEAKGFALAYQWFFKGTPVPGATNRILRLSGLHVGDGATSEGDYSVAVASPTGDLVFSTPARLRKAPSEAWRI